MVYIHKEDGTVTFNGFEKKFDIISSTTYFVGCLIYALVRPNDLYNVGILLHASDECADDRKDDVFIRRYDYGHMVENNFINVLLDKRRHGQHSAVFSLVALFRSP
uniref:Uncharacterized protein n=1 Tax=Haemonchus contortus TaxID=6289 RepID=W6NAP6_HAECO